jgi:hypothetical protein
MSEVASQQIVEQVKEVTKTTEEIKAEISTGIWDEQNRWEMKRDDYLKVALKTRLQLPPKTPTICP